MPFDRFAISCWYSIYSATIIPKYRKKSSPCGVKFLSPQGVKDDPSIKVAFHSKLGGFIQYSPFQNLRKR
jgi:hypothetical protein